MTNLDARTQPQRLPRVLVILAVYEGEAWLEGQLQSIFSQAGVEVTVLAADDGSSDDSTALLLRWRESGHSLELMPAGPRRVGAAGTFFRLLAAARADEFDAVALADQDDIWLSDRLAPAISSLAVTGAAGYSSDVIAFWPDGRERKLGKACQQKTADYLFEPAGPGYTYVLSPALAKLVQAELTSRPHRVAAIGYHDWRLYAFARTHGFSWYLDAEATVRYRQHAHNELGVNFGFNGFLRRVVRLTSGWYRDQVLRIGEAWPNANDEWISRLRRLNLKDRFWLAFRTREMWRRPRDQWALSFFLVSGVLR